MIVTSANRNWIVKRLRVIRLHDNSEVRALHRSRSNTAKTKKHGRQHRTP